jgi:hypothetical protein
MVRRGGEKGFSDRMTWRGSEQVFSEHADGKRGDFFNVDGKGDKNVHSAHCIVLHRLCLMVE